MDGKETILIGDTMAFTMIDIGQLTITVAQQDTTGRVSQRKRTRRRKFIDLPSAHRQAKLNAMLSFIAHRVASIGSPTYQANA